ncbi:transmembrane protein, putative, partial [Bodo saltans]
MPSSKGELSVRSHFRASTTSHTRFTSCDQCEEFHSFPSLHSTRPSYAHCIKTERSSDLILTTSSYDAGQSFVVHTLFFPHLLCFPSVLLFADHHFNGKYFSLHSYRSKRTGAFGLFVASLLFLLLLPLGMWRSTSTPATPFAAAQTWTLQSCATTTFSNPATYYQLTACSIATLTILDGAGLWLDGGSYNSIDLSAVPTNPFVFKATNAAITSSSTYLINFPASMSHWVIRITDSSTLMSSSSSSGIRFGGTVTSTSIAILSSSFSTTNAASHNMLFGGVITNVSLTMTGAIVSASGSSFQAVAAVDDLSLVVGDGTSWSSSSGSLLTMFGAVNGFTAVCIGETSGILLSVEQQHFSFGANAINIYFSATNTDVTASYRPTDSYDGTDADQDLGLLYFSGGFEFSNISAYMSDHDEFNVDYVVRVEGTSTTIDNILVSVTNYVTTGADVYVAFIYTRSTSASNIKLYVDNSALYCSYGCVLLGTATNVVVQLTAVRGAVYLAVVVADSITNAEIKYTSDPNSYTEDGGGDSNIASTIDGLLNVQASMVNVTMFLSGTGIEMYGTPAVSGSIPEFAGLVASNAATLISAIHVMISSTEYHDRSFTPNGASFLNLNAATITGLSLVVQNSQFYGSLDVQDSTLCLLANDGGNAHVTDVDIRILSSEFASLIDPLLSASMDTTSSNFRLEMTSVAFSTSWASAGALISLPAGAQVAVYLDACTITSASTGTFHQLVSVGTDGITSSGVVISLYRTSFSCNKPCAAVVFAGTLEHSLIRIESSTLLNIATSGSATLAFLSSPTSSTSQALLNGALKFIDLSFAGSSHLNAQIMTMSSPATFTGANIFVKCVSNSASGTLPMLGLASGGVVSSSTSITIYSSVWYASADQIFKFGSALGSAKISLLSLTLSAGSAMFDTSSMGSGVFITYGCVTFNGAAVSTANVATKLSPTTFVNTPVATSTCTFGPQCGHRTMTRTKTRSLSIEPEVLEVYDHNVFAITKTYGSTVFFSGSSVTYMNQVVGTVNVSSG